MAVLTTTRVIYIKIKVRSGFFNIDFLMFKLVRDDRLK